MEDNIFDTINKCHLKKLNNDVEKSQAVALFNFIALNLKDVVFEDILFYVIYIELKRQKDFLLYVVDILDKCLNHVVMIEDYLLAASINNIKKMVLDGI